MPEGQIIKALSGYYYVHEEGSNQIWQCRARGVFKKRGISPLVGDYVSFEPSSNGEGTVTEIAKRRNELIRPPIANVDQALLVFSIEEPEFNQILLDKFIVHIEKADITPIICLTKLDLAATLDGIPEEMEIYQKIGYEVFITSSKTKIGLSDVEEYLKGKTTVFAGQSGVGKSTLLNELDPSLQIETGEISLKLGRGRHTTRHVELIRLPSGGMVADTPGFSQLDFSSIEAEELSGLFLEFRDYSEQCKFRGCLHQNEPSCAVKSAVEKEEISSQRYQNYLQFLVDIQSEKQKRRY
ncbi:ribosome small subunit-dependent GTPase A [Caldalkalibacillus mannanilyticus]|uniref:ribosome small subunit-dependent GTPase A n=1 Tax=Caldalkalibacillus mannanilyticus TaxID=1418 RepID=UPI00046954D1|nr:ribosome small subunit-dependent GTPase A [Caldalkalibacillus mannanilyticus]